MNKKNIYIGWDIGGAHTKYTINSKALVKPDSIIIPLQLWKSLEPLKKLINDIYDKYSHRYTIINGLTMSGEMCDLFNNREEGVKKILSLFNRGSSKNYIYTSKHGIVPMNKYKNYKSFFEDLIRALWKLYICWPNEIIYKLLFCCDESLEEESLF